jgi:hypothetical protein
LSAIAGLNALSIFYDRLKEIRELHRHGDEYELVRHVSAAAPFVAEEGL